MKIVHVATIDIGGAYQAAMRLHTALKQKGMDSKILLRTKTDSSHEGEVVFASKMGEVLSKAKNVWNLTKKDGDISRDVLGTDISRHPFIQSADVIILHWINSFLTEKEIEKLARLNKPILWFMHDMWLFTGGCHVDGYCGKYEIGCGGCPQTKSGKEQDITSLNATKKKELLQKIRPIIAGPSHWIVECAKKSAVTCGQNILYLPNMIDTQIFHMPDTAVKEQLRNRYQIISAKKVVLFGAADAGTENDNKGFSYLREALSYLDRERFQLVVFGNSGRDLGLPEGFEVHKLGFISSQHQMAEIYQLADVFVNPSNQESFGFTTCEAMACGVCCVSFPIGGLKDQITHMENGYLARYHDAEDLARGIACCVEHEEWKEKARSAAERFSMEKVVEQYIEVLEKL